MKRNENGEGEKQLKEEKCWGRKKESVKKARKKRIRRVRGEEGMKERRKEGRGEEGKEWMSGGKEIMCTEREGRK